MNPALMKTIAPFLIVLMASCVPSLPVADTDDEACARDFPNAQFLHREEACYLSEDSECGYPSGPYGSLEASVFENLMLNNCEGELVELAQFFQQRPDTGTLNRGVILALGAGWCPPCIEEAEHFAEKLVDLYRPDEVEFVHLILEGAPSLIANASNCTEWLENYSESKYPVLYTEDETLFPQLSPDLSLPVMFALDANAHVRFTQGGIVEDPTLDLVIQDLICDPYGP